MKIAQTLRRPANWQDFESLCLLLWRAEWKSEDLKKNGRNGQAQKGVDICGHKEGESEYSGIQCKCKPGNKPLSIDDIDDEIENALEFKPALRRLVFATTADKDASIEEYVRIKDVENREKNLFSIDIKSWQDIIDMLEINKQVLNMYLDIVAEDYAVTVMFENKSMETIICPKFMRINYLESLSQNKTKPIINEKQPSANIACDLLHQYYPSYEISKKSKTSKIATVRIVRGHIETNHAFCPIKIVVINNGKSPIDDYKIVFTFSNTDVLFATTNVKKTEMILPISFSKRVSNVKYLDGEGITMLGNSIVPGDYDVTDDLFIHFPNDVQDVQINWKLLSRQFSEEGILRLVVQSEYIDEERVNKEKAGCTDIIDYIEVQEILD